MNAATPCFLTSFHRVAPRFLATQDVAIAWLAAAHARAPHAPGDAERLTKLLSRFGCGPDRIAQRACELEDFTHFDFSRMKLFGDGLPPEGAGADARFSFFESAVESIFERFYAAGSHAARGAPSDLLHVTCTGYVSPSGAQKLVARRGWQRETTVTHAYHMGCYAAIPAARIASGFLQAGRPRVDVVHTELCTLHLNPALHEPEQLVVQSLFADGFMRYEVLPKPAKDGGFEILSLREEIVPDSVHDMEWRCSNWGMRMTLSREVPARITGLLESYFERLAAEAGVSYASAAREAIFAVHPGGPRIIDGVAETLGLQDAQVAHSHAVLRDHGNMSSATLPHIWQRILEDPAVRAGTPVFSVAFGPGLTIAGALLRKV